MFAGFTLGELVIWLLYAATEHFSASFGGTTVLGEALKHIGLNAKPSMTAIYIGAGFCARVLFGPVVMAAALGILTLQLLLATKLLHFFSSLDFL